MKKGKKGRGNGLQTKETNESGQELLFIPDAQLPVLHLVVKAGRKRLYCQCGKPLYVQKSANDDYLVYCRTCAKIHTYSTERACQDNGAREVASTASSLAGGGRR